MLWWVAVLDDGVSAEHGMVVGRGGDNDARFRLVPSGPAVRLQLSASFASYSHDDGSIPGHVLAANDVDFGEEGDNGPGGDAAQRAVEEVGVRHGGGGQEQARAKPPGL